MCMYSTGRGTKLLGSGILCFAPPSRAPRRAIPNLARLGEMTHPERGAYEEYLDVFKKKLTLSLWNYAEQ